MTEKLSINKDAVLSVQFKLEYQFRNNHEWTFGWIGTQQEVRDRAESLRKSDGVTSIRVTRVIREVVYEERVEKT